MLELRNLTKQYGGERAIDELSLSVDDGEFLTILGPSGSGKTTTLLSIAGHVTPTAGSISLDGTELTGVPPENRSLGIVFQQDALFEHMTARENVAYALGPHEGEWDHGSRVDEFLSLVGMAHYGDSYPAQLSAPLIPDLPDAAFALGARYQLHGETRALRRGSTAAKADGGRFRACYAGDRGNRSICVDDFLYFMQNLFHCSGGEGG